MVGADTGETVYLLHCPLQGFPPYLLHKLLLYLLLYLLPYLCNSSIGRNARRPADGPTKRHPGRVLSCPSSCAAFLPCWSYPCPALLAIHWSKPTGSAIIPTHWPCGRTPLLTMKLVPPRRLCRCSRPASRPLVSPSSVSLSYCLLALPSCPAHSSYPLAPPTCPACLSRTICRHFLLAALSSCSGYHAALLSCLLPRSQYVTSGPA